jgi:hypothetical protein
MRLRSLTLSVSPIVLNLSTASHKYLAAGRNAEPLVASVPTSILSLVASWTGPILLSITQCPSIAVLLIDTLDPVIFHPPRNDPPVESDMSN